LILTKNDCPGSLSSQQTNVPELLKFRGIGFIFPIAERNYSIGFSSFLQQLQSHLQQFLVAIKSAIANSKKLLAACK